MLKRLSISQFVIIDNLSIDFAEGLTVLTGETGAGKSILLDAMGLILGDEPDREAVRQGANESVIEALFMPPSQHPIWEFLKTLDGVRATPPVMTIKRTISRFDKDEILVAGTPVSLETLKTLGTYLVEIHGQFANQSFLAPESQLFLLDAFGAYPPEIMKNVADAFNRIGQLMRELEEEKNFLAQADRERHTIEKAVIEIEKIGLKKGQYEELLAELARLVNIRDISDAFHAINAQLVAQSGAELILSRVDHALATHEDPALDQMKACIKTALENTRGAITEMQLLAPKYLDVDTSDIHKIEKRLEDIRWQASESKVKPEELFAKYEFLSARLARIKGAPAKIKALDDDLIKANETYRQHARILSDERQKAAKRLGAEITAEMPLLKLMSAQAVIEVTEDPTRRTILGINDVSFTARMNPGMPFSPIAKTASGGELARLILAVKMILQQVAIVSTLVFDEIDTGIGGAAAAAVGSRIAKLSDSTQILVITHSPQVASRGMQHLHVSKQTDGMSTHTVVDTLTIEQRINEISRMLAGEEITPESYAAAKTLIVEAARAAEARKAGIQEQIPPPVEEAETPAAEPTSSVEEPPKEPQAD